MSDYKRPVGNPTRFIAPEDFERWCADPVTQFVAASYMATVQAARETWERMSWEGGHADPNALLELRTRADCYSGFTQAGWREHAANLASYPVWRKHFEDEAKAEQESRKERKAHG